MIKEELIEKVSALVPGEFAAESQWPEITIDPSGWLPAAIALKNDPLLSFDYLFCVTCVDWKTHLTMVYHLESTSFRHTLVVKAKLAIENPTIHSVEPVWKTASFHEREAYEMFGVHFTGHPDLRLLILPDGWEGRNPMRKDFEDPVNMIRL